MIKADSEAAFPNAHFNDVPGMTLRDYFAAKAMQGLTSILDQACGEPVYSVIAQDSYRMADAMLKARIS